MIAWVKAMTPVIAIFAVCAIEAFAIAHGINGYGVTAAVGAICGIGGFRAKEIFNRKENV